MPCDKNTYKCEFDDIMPDCCYKHLVQVIHYITELFENENIKYWIYFGTLLGAIRNKKIIPWDSDGDIGVFVEDKERIYNLKDKIIEDGYGFYKHHENLLQITYSLTNWSYCDIWFYDKITSREHINPIENDEIVLRSNVPWMQIYNTCDFPYWFVEELLQTKLEGKLVKCPRCPNKVLDMIYGPNWRIPGPKQGIGSCYSPLIDWLEFSQKQKLLIETQGYLNKKSHLKNSPK